MAFIVVVKRLALFISLLYVLISTSYSQQLIAYPTKRAIKKMDMKPGIRVEQIDLSDGKQWEFKVIIPESAKTDTTDLIIALHWSVFAPSFFQEGFMNCLVQPAIEGSDFMVIAPKANLQAWWESPKIDQLKRLMVLIKKYWKVKNILLVGYSDGATGSVHIAGKFPDLVDGVVAMAGNYQFTSKPITPTFLCHSEDDDVFNYHTALNFFKTLSSNTAFFKKKTGLTHTNSCEYVESLKEGLKWVESKLN